MTASSSLFDAPATPVLASATDWVGGTLFGGVAATLCIIAVAFVGLMMMTGRATIRDGARVVVASFILLGAPLVAAALRDAADGAVPSAPPGMPAIEATPPPPELPRADYDPYAGASVPGTRPFR